MSNGPRASDDLSPDIQAGMDRARSMRADLESASRAKTEPAMRMRQFRRDTPLGAKQIETVYNDPNLTVARCVSIEIGGFPYYEVWYFDALSTSDEYDHTKTGILEEREVVSPAALAVDRDGNRILPKAMEVAHDDKIEYDGALKGAAPDRKRKPKRGGRRANPERS